MSELTTNQVESQRITALSALEMILPILEASTAYAEAPLCNLTDKKGEPLSEAGRRIAEGLYLLLLDAWEATRVLADGPPPGFSQGSAPLDDLTAAVFLARGLTAGDVPEQVSGHDGLLELLKLARRAEERLAGREA